MVDTLIMAENPQQAQEHVLCLIFLPENLGFIISHLKCLETNRVDSLPRVHSGLRRSGTPSAYGKSERDQVRDRKIDLNTGSTSKEAISTAGQAERCPQGQFLSPHCSIATYRWQISGQLWPRLLSSTENNTPKK